jgi:hypothetical protein
MEHHDHPNDPCWWVGDSDQILCDEVHDDHDAAAMAMSAQAAAATLRTTKLAAVSLTKALRAASATDSYTWPNGAGLEGHRTVITPTGTVEIFPARCTVWEDGAAVCGEFGTVAP